MLAGGFGAAGVIGVPGEHGRGLEMLDTLSGLICKCIGRLTLVMIWMLRADDSEYRRRSLRNGLARKMLVALLLLLLLL